MEINQIYVSGVRFISTASITPNLDAKLIAFYTILTVALSIMLSFKQSRCMLINNYTTYPLIKVKKCLKCLKRTKKHEYGNNKKISDEKNELLNSKCNNEIGVTLATSTYASFFSSYTYSDYTKYLKLKSLKRLTIATLSTGTQVLSNMNSRFHRIKQRRGTWKRNGNEMANGLSFTCKHRKIKLTDQMASNAEKGLCESCQSLSYNNHAFSATMPVFPKEKKSIFHKSASLSQLMTSSKNYNSKVKFYTFICD